MKRIIVILLALIYGASSSGMTLHIHFCCGKVDKIDFVPVQRQCGMSHKMTTKKCCSDKEVSLKIHSEQKAEFATVSFTGANQQAKILFNYWIIEEIVFTDPLICFSDHAPPSGYDVPVHILHCVYRI